MNPGRVLVGLLFAIGILGSLVSGAPIYSRILYLSTLLLTVSWLWARLSLQGMKIVRQARSLRANVGDIFEEHFEVTNNGMLACLWVEVLNASLMPGAKGSRLLTGIGRHQKRSYVARTWLMRRGSFSLGPTALTSGDPFGLFKAQKQFPALDSLVVLPMLVEIASFPSPLGLLPGGKPISRKAIDVTPHASSVREYNPGDPLKRIHWPSTVRRGQLMVKEFDRDPQAEVWLFMDAQATVHAEQPYELSADQLDGWLFSKRPTFSLPPSTLEYAISITASLAHYFIGKDRAVGFVASGQVQTIIPAERTVRQEDKILEVLAFLEAEGELPLGSLVSAQAKQLPRGSSAILVTPTTQPEILIAVDDLQRRDLKPVVVLLISESFGGLKGGEILAQSLMDRNIPVCSVYNGADLSQALSGLVSSTADQEIATRWFKPTYTP
jgi:uncharacterized protein (DUF58 family)